MTEDLLARIAAATVDGNLPECVQCLKLALIRIRKQETTIKALGDRVRELEGKENG